MHDYLLARTVFVDAVVLGALERGITQIVLLGAGYDGRALRYRGEATWFEVDLASTQQDKRERLARLGIDVAHIRFAPADFRYDDVGSLLCRAGLDPSLPTVAVLEGVAPYLERARLESLLRSLRQVAAPGSRLALTMSVRPPALRLATRVRRARFRRAVAAMGEPIRNTIGADELGPLLARTGWRGAPAPRAVQGAERGRRLGFVVAEPSCAPPPG